jgi:hypothetical protein
MFVSTVYVLSFVGGGLVTGPIPRPRSPPVFCQMRNYMLILMGTFRPPLWSSGQFLVTDPEVRVLFPALQDFPRSSGSGRGSTQPREYN